MAMAPTYLLLSGLDGLAPWAATRGGEVHRSTDGGQTWRHEGLRASQLDDLVLGDEEGGVYVVSKKLLRGRGSYWRQLATGG
jgi:hypothetical protein